jgi:hypothetical protein
MAIPYTRKEKALAIALGYSERSPGVFTKADSDGDHEYQFYITRHADGYEASYNQYTLGRTAVYGDETVIAEECNDFSMAHEMIGNFNEFRPG